MRCVNGAWRVFCTFFVAQECILRIILDTGKETVTVPWNYAAKLEKKSIALSRTAAEPSSTPLRPVWKRPGKSA